MSKQGYSFLSLRMSFVQSFEPNYTRLRFSKAWHLHDQTKCTDGLNKIKGTASEERFC